MSRSPWSTWLRCPSFASGVEAQTLGPRLQMGTINLSQPGLRAGPWVGFPCWHPVCFWVRGCHPTSHLFLSQGSQPSQLSQLSDPSRLRSWLVPSFMFYVLREFVHVFYAWLPMIVLLDILLLFCSDGAFNYWCLADFDQINSRLQLGHTLFSEDTVV